MSLSLALRGALGVALLACGCDAPRVTPDGHGVSVEPGPCGRGLIVVESDYQSSNVSLLDFDGQVLTTSLASSSTTSSGFGVALSGDVVPPSDPQTGSSIALIDRYPAGVLRFVDLASARVTSELSVATGFKSNPHDYLALDAHRAYVSRYESNPNPGREAFDPGGDILIVDPSAPAIVGRIDLSPALALEAPRFSAHPSQLLRVGRRVFASLAAYADDYSSSASSRLVELDADTDTLVATLVLDGLHGCDGLALSPDQLEIAVACTGDDWNARPPKLVGSGLAFVDITAHPTLKKRFDAADLGPNVVGFALDYAAPKRLFFSTLGYFGESGAAARQDSLLVLDSETGQVSEVLRSESEPFTLGGVRCVPSCGACFATDAERAQGSVLRFPLDAQGVLAEATAIRVETQIGLPPRYLAVF